MIFDVIKIFGQQCKDEKGTKTEARLFLGAPHGHRCHQWPAL
jgi:hypothetical protein